VRIGHPFQICGFSADINEQDSFVKTLPEDELSSYSVVLKIGNAIRIEKDGSPLGRLLHPFLIRGWQSEYTSHLLDTLSLVHISIDTVLFETKWRWWKGDS
jgi:hypothetical protein